jgi:hypothetical protein
MLRTSCSIQRSQLPFFVPQGLIHAGNSGEKEDTKLDNRFSRHWKAALLHRFFVWLLEQPKFPCSCVVRSDNYQMYSFKVKNLSHAPSLIRQLFIILKGSRWENRSGPAEENGPLKLLPASNFGSDRKHVTDLADWVLRSEGTHTSLTYTSERISRIFNCGVESDGTISSWDGGISCTNRPARILIKRELVYCFAGVTWRLAAKVGCRSLWNSMIVVMQVWTYLLSHRGRNVQICSSYQLYNVNCLRSILDDESLEYSLQFFRSTNMPEVPKSLGLPFLCLTDAFRTTFSVRLASHFC